MQLSQFRDEYISYSLGVHSPNTTDGVGVAFVHLLRIIGDREISSIGVRDVEGFLSAKKRQASDWTARKYYITLSSAFQTAKRWGYLQENPFRSVKRPRTREVQPAFFTRTGFAQLLHTLDENWRVFVLTAVSTGMRQSELTALRWVDVDLAEE